MSDSGDTISGVKNTVSTMLAEVHTAMPGVVVSYDAATRRATVLPSLSKQLADGRVLPAPQIVSVPVIFPTGSNGRAGITFPIVPGDGVMLHFSERSLEAWHDAGGATPDDPRQFDLSDAVAVPGLNHGGATPAAHADNMVITFGAASISMTPAGTMIFHASGFEFDGGNVVVPANDVIATGKSLRTHVHGGVVTGGGTTGMPS
ncbi:MAG: Phage-related protein [Rhodoferax sp.]|nr:Phage-related protein [Rhodoferax sp.]